MGGQPTDSNCGSSDTYSAGSDSTGLARSNVSDSDISRSEGGSTWDSSDGQSDTSIVSEAKEKEVAKYRADQQLKEALKHMQHVTSSPAATPIQVGRQSLLKGSRLGLAQSLCHKKPSEIL